MKKLLRILGTVLGLLLVVGYFAFSTYFFSPFEGGLDADVAGLVPRKVQFFAAKAHLDRDFDPFPRLAAAEDFALDETWSSVLQSPEYSGLMEAIGVEAALAEVEAAAGDLPGCFRARQPATNNVNGVLRIHLHFAEQIALKGKWRNTYSTSPRT